MAAVRTGTAIVCTGTTTVSVDSYPLDIVGILGAPTTSATITDGTNTIWSCAAARVYDPIEFRSKTDLVVTVVGGGQVTLFLRVD